MGKKGKLTSFGSLEDRLTIMKGFKEESDFFFLKDVVKKIKEHCTFVFIFMNEFLFLKGSVHWPRNPGVCL